jgi:NADH-quinone oxidoreductase subunit E
MSGLTTLKDFESGKTQYNGAVQRAVDIGDTVRRIDGTEVPLTTPWLGKAVAKPARKPAAKAKAEAPAAEAGPGAKPRAKAAPRKAKPKE